MSELMILCSLRHVLEICLLLNMLTIVLLHSSSSSSSSGQNFGALLLHRQIDRCHEKSSPLGDVRIAKESFDLTDLLSEPVEPVHHIELNRLKRFASPVSTNPQIT